MLTLIGVLLLVGIALWAVNYLPIVDGNIKKIIYVIIVVCTAIYLLNYFGIMPNLPK